MVAVLVGLRSTPETAVGSLGPTLRATAPALRSPRFLGVVGPMAPWVFAAPAIVFALLPSVVGADHAHDGIALAAAITALCALAGVLVQPLARRLDASDRGNRAATTGLLVLAVGLVIGAVTAQVGEIWLLAPCAILLGCAYGLCLVAGLVEIQRMADTTGLGGLTAVYYALTCLGFAAPYLLATSAPLAGYPSLLAVTAALTLGAAALLTRGAAQPAAPRTSEA